MSEVALLTVMILAAAILYSSVGHAGASGYLAAMALVGVAPDVMKPTALALNILVATIATARYYRAGYFRWAALWPFAIGSIPLSFVGGAIILPGYLYKPAVGLVLFYAAYRLFRSKMGGPQEAPDKGINVPVLPAVAWGGTTFGRDHSPPRGSAIRGISLDAVGGDLLRGDPALGGNYPRRILQRIVPRAASYLGFDGLQPTQPRGR